MAFLSWRTLTFTGATTLLSLRYYKTGQTGEKKAVSFFLAEVKTGKD